MRLQIQFARALMVALAAAVVAACNGDIEIRRPLADDPFVTDAQPVRLAFTASDNWTLLSARLSRPGNPNPPLDVTNRFQPNSGEAGVLSEAEVISVAGDYVIEIEAQVDGAQKTKSQTFRVRPGEVAVEVPSFTPADSPELLSAPVKVVIRPNFDWTDLEVVTVAGPSAGETTQTSNFSRTDGGAGEDATAMLQLPQGAHDLYVTVRTALNREAHGAPQTLRVASGAPPLCNMPLECLPPAIPPTNFVPVGTDVSPIPSCGGGTTAYGDGTRQTCTPLNNQTKCVEGVSGRLPIRRFVSGVATCVSGRSFLDDPPQRSEQLVQPGPGQCMDACSDLDLNGNGRIDPDESTTCGPGERKVPSLGGGRCSCGPCP